MKLTWRYLLGHGSDVGESFPEDNEDFSGAAAQSWRGAVERRVTDSQYDHVPA